MDSSNDADREPEPKTMKKMRGDDSRSENADDDLQMTPVDKLGEDELTLIFSNSWLSTQDLLNLRLVNKTWSDAATTTLRQRDACVVELSGDFDQNPPCFYKNGRKTEEFKLSQLTELISKSKKFPSTNFRILTFYVPVTPYTLFPDLMNFFKLHGDKIKTLGPRGWIFQNHIRDILLIYAPVLEHLDLSKASIRKNVGPEENALNWTSKTLSFKYLTISDFGGVRCHCLIPGSSYLMEVLRDGTGKTCGCNYNVTDLVNSFLLTTPSKLRSIENVILESLRTVLIQGKGHLIRSFNYQLMDEDALPSAPLMEFVALNPKLTKLTLNLNYSNSPPEAFITSVNGLIQSSKDTVQNLTISFQYDGVSWHQLLSIPQMKKLNSLTLELVKSFRLFHEYPRSTCQDCGKCVKNNIDLMGKVFEFKDGIPAQNYFSILMDVTFHSRYSTLYEFSPMSFFSFKPNADVDSSFSNWNCLPKVDKLNITKMSVESKRLPCVSCQPPTEASLISEVFPNIRILKFQCDDVGNLSCALWAMSPNVEFMEIYGIACYSVGGRDFGKSHYVDKVFTGYSERMLENLRRSAAGLPCAADDSEELKSAPSISDLRRLKELKLKFVGRWSTKFASFVTGLHAFSKMENTKFIISYDPCVRVWRLNPVIRIEDGDDNNDNDENTGHENDGDDDRRNQFLANTDAGNDSAEHGDDGIANYEELIFGPLKPYVHIVHEVEKLDFMG